MKKLFYISLLVIGFQINSFAQSKPVSKEDAVKTVKFYPNPAVSYINFVFEKDYNNSSSLIIYNFLGKKISEQKIGEQKINLSLNNFYRGIYIFQICDQRGQVLESGKFQVVK